MKKIYEVKVSRFNWEYVLADSMMVVNQYCKENNITDWRCVGMLSRDEIEHIRKTAKSI